jgi:hypothetical protein
MIVTSTDLIGYLNGHPVDSTMKEQICRKAIIFFSVGKLENQNIT